MGKKQLPLILHVNTAPKMGNYRQNQGNPSRNFSRGYRFNSKAQETGIIKIITIIEMDILITAIIIPDFRTF